MDEARFHSRSRRADEETAVEQAKVQLRRGIERSRRIVADYRRRLTRLGRDPAPAPAPAPAERPLFGWRKD